MDAADEGFDVAEVLHRLDRLEALEHEVRALRSELAARPEPAAVASPVIVPVPVAAVEPPPLEVVGSPDDGLVRTAGATRVDRRRALKAGAAAVAAAATGAVLLDAAPAAAANGSPLVLGSSAQGCTSPTAFAGTGSAFTYGLAISDNSSIPASAFGGNPTILAHAKGSAFNTGVQVTAENYTKGIQVTVNQGTGLRVDKSGANGWAIETVGDVSVQGVMSAISGGSGVRAQGGLVGVEAITNTGKAIYGYAYSTGTGLEASSQQGPALVARSTSASGATITAQTYQLRLGPSFSRSAPTSDTYAHATGEFVVDSAGDHWVCVASGTPGTFRKISGPATSGQLHTLAAPVRVYDSRPGTTPTNGSKTPLTANTARAIDLKVNGSGIPAGATAVACNLTLLNATNGTGFFAIWANGVTRGPAITMGWGGSAGCFSSFALTKVDANAFCQVLATLPTDLVIDIAGYYR